MWHLALMRKYNVVEIGVLLLYGLTIAIGLRFLAFITLPKLAE